MLLSCEAPYPHTTPPALSARPPPAAGCAMQLQPHSPLFLRTPPLPPTPPPTPPHLLSPHDLRPLVAARRSYNAIDEDAREEARGALAFVEELYV